MIHTVKGFGIVNKAKVDVFLELSCFLDDPAEHLEVLCSHTVKPILLKPQLENFTHYFASVRDECNCAVA